MASSAVRHAGAAGDGARGAVGRWEDALGTMNDALDRYEALGQVEAIGRLGWAMVYQPVWTARFVEECRSGGGRCWPPATVSIEQSSPASNWRFTISIGGDYATATATFDQARALAEQVEIGGP